MFKLLKKLTASGALPLIILFATVAYTQTSYAQRRGDFHNGVREGQSGGQYSQSPRHQFDRNGYDQQGYDRDGYNQNGYNPSGYNRDGRPDGNDRGGIGPGKGAMIGGAGGAILGAMFGGGLKGTLIGGAAGAGIGALVGKEHQNSERNQNQNYRPR